MWQDSNIGNYIEFKLQITYHEGHENTSARNSLSDGTNDSREQQLNPNQWIIYKRYSNFVDLHEALVPFFKAEGLQIPMLPPKIANEASS